MERRSLPLEERHSSLALRRIRLRAQGRDARVEAAERRAGDVGVEAMEGRRDRSDPLGERIDRWTNVGNHLPLHWSQRLDDTEPELAGLAPHDTLTQDDLVVEWRGVP